MPSVTSGPGSGGPLELDFDSRYGTDTSGEIRAERLGHLGEVAVQSVGYEASDTDAFLVMVRELPIRHQDYAFVDIGSGKERATLLAASIPFAGVVGVEASAALHRVACRNVACWRKARGDATQACDIELRHQDAAKLDLPDQPTVVYLFNPFRARQMARVLLRFKEWLASTSHDLWVIYYNPQLDYMFDKTAYLSRVARGVGYPQGDYAIYRRYEVSEAYDSGQS